MNQYKNIDEYIENFPANVQEILEKVRSVILTIIPNASEAISYGIPTFKLDGKNIMHFAAYKHHIGIYPGAEAIEIFKDKIKEFNTSKGTIQFPIEKPIPYDIIKEITKFRLQKTLDKPAY